METYELEIELRLLVNQIKNKVKIEGKVMYIDLNDILDINHKVYDLLIEDFEKYYYFLNQAVKNVFLKDYEIRLTNLRVNTNISKIRVSNIGQLLSVKGIIKRTTKVIPRVYEISYLCENCGTITTIKQEKRTKIKPLRCVCGKKDMFNEDDCKTKDIQEINLEESHESTEGKQPQQIRVYLEGELTDRTLNSKLQPGKRVEIIGVVKKLPAFMSAKDEELNISEFMLQSNNVISLEEDDDLIISADDEEKIKDIAKNNPLDLLTNSLVPEIYGNNMVKKAIVLQMIKGVSKKKANGNVSQNDIHILLCGDVGVAKSQILKAASIKSPKSRMVVGTKTSKVALGAMAVRDEMLGSWSLECGAIVQANGGILCVDELDKMHKEHLADLLEPMSAASVTVNKAGISATLPANTSILAAANPIHGNYELSTPLAKQIDLPPPIINRFDLIFVLIDKPDEPFDSSMIEHVFRAYKETPKLGIPNDLFKKYITYCKKLKPSISDNLLKPIQDFYINLRKKSERSNARGIPINMRSIEGLIKLSEAHAKLRLSDTVEKIDFDAAKEIMIYCLSQIGYDEEEGIYDLSRITEKVPLSHRKKIDIILNILDSLEQKFGKDIYYKEILFECEKQSIPKWEMSGLLDELKRMTKIIEPRAGVYNLLA